jgi:hypothetical protein
VDLEPGDPSASGTSRHRHGADGGRQHSDEASSIGPHRVFPYQTTYHRVVRRLAWIALPISILAVALAVGVTLQRRELARALLLARLRGLGVAAPELAIESLGPRGAVLRNLRAGDGGELEVAELEATWSLSQLRRGRFDSVRASGVRVSAALDEGGLSLGSLDPAWKRAEPASTPAAPPALPARRIRIEDAAVALATPAGPLEAEVSLAIEDGTASLRAATSAAELARNGSTLVIPDLHLDATLGLEADRTEFDLAVCTRGREVFAVARGALDPDGDELRADVELYPVRFEAGGLQPGDLLPALRLPGSEIRGSLEAVGSLYWQDGALRSAVDVGVHDLRIETRLATLDGLSTGLHLVGIWPPSTPADQELAVATVDFGLRLRDGLVRYRIRPDGRVEVAKATFAFAGGRIRTAGLFDPSSERHAIDLEVAEVDLAALIELLDIDGLSGEGTVGGRLPIVWSGDAVEVRGGELTTAAGGGWIRYRPAGAAGTGLAALGSETSVLLGALSNLHYERLSLTLDGDTHDVVTVGLKVRGQNPDYRDGHPVELNVNVESRLADLLRDATTVYELPRTVAERLRGIAARREYGAAPARPKKGSAVDRTPGCR